MRKKVIELLDDGVGPTEVARLCGLSRKSVYKWRDRSEADGDAGLLDRSRARLSVERFEGELAEWLLELRRRFPTWGPKKLLDHAYIRRPDDTWPARSTLAALLKRRGLVAHKRPPATKRIPFLQAGPTPSEPNARWSMDFKGDFRLGDGTLTKPFTLRDSASRMILDLFVTSSTHTRLVRHRLEKAFLDYGMPEQIQSDTGAPFASTGIGRLSMLSVWLLRNDVMPVLSRPGKPQDNGAHERMHRDYKAEATRPPAPNQRAQQRRSDRWRRHYNEERPHEALGGQVPASQWKPSPRCYTPRRDPLEYPSWWEARSVDTNGDFKWRNHLIPCGKALRHQRLGFQPFDDGLWRVHLAKFPVAIFDERDGYRLLNLLPE